MATEVSLPAAGAVLGNRYRLTGRIAGGGMGEVWRASDEVLDREVAVKILRREYADDPTFLERFRAEARSAARLSHPGIAAVYDFGETGSDSAGDGSASPGEPGSPFLVMELVPGEPLSAVLGRCGSLRPDRTLDIVAQTAEALQAAHDAGVIHRDVKPGNILVTPDDRVKITDFGIALVTNAVPLTATGTIVGTAHYISPEQATRRSVTPATDIYSLGVVAYECLAGRRPFDGDTPVSVVLAQVRTDPPALPGDLPPAVQDLVLRMLAKEPERRPADAAQVAREAAALRSELGRQPAPVGTLSDPPAPAHHAAFPAGADTDPGFELPTARSGRSWLGYVALAASLSAVLLFGYLLAGRALDDGGSAASPPGAAAATSPGRVTVLPGAFIGRPVDEVRADLRGLGLRVTVEWTAGGGRVGTVKAVAPTGALKVGSLVRLRAVAATVPPEPSPAAPPGADREGQAEPGSPGLQQSRTGGPSRTTNDQGKNDQVKNGPGKADGGKADKGKADQGTAGSGRKDPGRDTSGGAKPRDAGTKAKGDKP